MVDTDISSEVEAVAEVVSESAEEQFGSEVVTEELIQTEASEVLDVLSDAEPIEEKLTEEAAALLEEAEPVEVSEPVPGESGMDDDIRRLLADAEISDADEIAETVAVQDAEETVAEAVESEEAVLVSEVAEEAGTEETVDVDVQPASAEPVKQLSSAELFEMKQREYLKGRKVTRDIRDSSGRVIAPVGSVISEEILDEAKAHGKMIELVMNNRA